MTVAQVAQLIALGVSALGLITVLFKMGHFLLELSSALKVTVTTLTKLEANMEKFSERISIQLDDHERRIIRTEFRRGDRHEADL